MFYVGLILLSLSSVFAQTQIDEKLKGYIQTFGLRPLAKPQFVNAELSRLGNALFADRVLSGNNNISCMDCHHPANMTMDNLPLGLGEGSEGIQLGNRLRLQKKGKILARNTPALFNLNGINVMFWDGRVTFNPRTRELLTPAPLDPVVAKTLRSALAAQALFPMVNHEEMSGQPGSNPIANARNEHEAWELIIQKVLANPKYKAAFERIYPGQTINIGHVGEALAEFQRSAFFFADTNYDRYLQGDVTALTETQKQGMDVFFNKGSCGNCHNGEHLSGLGFQNVGVPQIGPGKSNGDDLGKAEWDPSYAFKYAFRVPPLRNVALTPPYMHNGALMTLKQVIGHYDNVHISLMTYEFVNSFRNYSERIQGHNHSTDNFKRSSLSAKLVPRLMLSGDEQNALLEFLTVGLTDRRLLPKK